MKSVKITKLDAAKRQLEIAIRLYFNNADPVSIHTLTRAAHTILSDLNKKFSGKPMMMSDYLVKDEYKKMFRDKLNEAKNHFKHANKDPNASIDFNAEINDKYIYDACTKYEELTGETVLYFRIFISWFVSKNIGYFTFSAEEEAKVLSIQKRYGNSRNEYFSDMLAVSGHLV